MEQKKIVDTGGMPKWEVRFAFLVFVVLCYTQYYSVFRPLCGRFLKSKRHHKTGVLDLRLMADSFNTSVAVAVAVALYRSRCILAYGVLHNILVCVRAWCTWFIHKYNLQMISSSSLPMLDE